MRHIRLLAYALCFTLHIGCARTQANKSENSYESTTTTTVPVNQNDSAISGDDLHVDTNYKYEYRTGSSGDYEYNYNVNGSDENGEYVSGNISITGKHGTGTITDENGDDHDIDVEWVGYGRLEATDENNNTYELEVE